MDVGRSNRTNYYYMLLCQQIKLINFYDIVELDISNRSNYYKKLFNQLDQTDDILI